MHRLSPLVMPNESQTKLKLKSSASVLPGPNGSLEQGTNKRSLLCETFFLRWRQLSTEPTMEVHEKRSERGAQ